MRISSSLWRTRLSRQAAGKVAGGEIHKRKIEWSSRTSAELNSCRGRFHVRKDVQGTILESSRTENPVNTAALANRWSPQMKLLPDLFAPDHGGGKLQAIRRPQGMFLQQLRRQ